MNHGNHKKTAIDHTLEKSGDAPVPPEVEARLRARLAGFREKLESKGGMTPSHGRHWVLRTAVGAAAVLALGFAVWLSFAPAITLADVQQAISEKPWIHISRDGGYSRWINLPEQRYFSRSQYANTLSIALTDHSRGVKYHYHNNWGEVIHETSIEAMPYPPTPWEWAVNSVDQPGLYQPAPEQNERHEVEEQGRRLIRFDVYDTGPANVRFLIRQVWVDPATRLPVRMRERSRNSPEFLESVFAFSETGPSDIFELGVPRGLPVMAGFAVGDPEAGKVIEAGRLAMQSFPRQVRIIERQHSSDGSLVGVIAHYLNGELARTETSMFDFSETEQKSRPTNFVETIDWLMEHMPTEGLVIHEGDYEYSGTALLPALRKPGSKVTLRRLRAGGSFPLRDLWSYQNMAPPLRLIKDAPDVPPGCVLLRIDEPDHRVDFYIDVEHDYICIKEVRYSKVEGVLARGRIRELSELKQLPSGHWYAGLYSDSVFSEFEVQVTPFQEEDFPAGCFDGEALLKDAIENGVEVVYY